VPIARPCAMADLKEIVAINVRRLRYDRGWTQEDLADRVGLSARYVGQIERAQASMTTPCSGGSRMRLRSRLRNWSHVLEADNNCPLHSRQYTVARLSNFSDSSISRHVGPSGERRRDRDRRSFESWQQLRPERSTRARRQDTGINTAVVPFSIASSTRSSGLRTISIVLPPSCARSSAY